MRSLLVKEESQTSPWVLGAALMPAAATTTAGQEAVPILNIVVPHAPHFPRVAGLPFFIVTCSASWISRWSLHFMQYPVIAYSFPVVFRINCPGAVSISFSVRSVLRACTVMLTLSDNPESHRVHVYTPTLVQ